MNGKRFAQLVLLVALGGVVMGGCISPTREPSDESDEVETPDAVWDTLQAVLDSLAANYADDAPAVGLTWVAELVTEEGIVGYSEYELTADGWVARIGYPIVAPSAVVYQVEIGSRDAGFSWQGEVDAQGQVTERLAPDVVLEALEAALAYLQGNYSDDAPEAGLAWIEELATPEGLVGASTFRFLSGEWIVTVSYPIVAPENVIYTVVVENDSTGFDWEGTVDPAGQVTETSGAGIEAIGWYGYVVGLAAAESQFDDYLVLSPESVGQVGIEGADADVQAQIVALRDVEEPGKYAHFWGTLTCDVLDYGGCQLLVAKLRVDGPAPDPGPDLDVVDGWEGTIESVEGWEPGLYEDYFVLAGDLGIRYGIDGMFAGATEDLNDEIEALRDSGTTVRIWGQLRSGVPDYNASQIAVERMEVAE
ncbi:MAG: hypothetical protein E3J64_03455 [Anaerolineales bacterium]|nr:MAG: hypothetical protein E3J64_03455 [Anaerolineales bacterium]